MMKTTFAQAIEQFKTQDLVESCLVLTDKESSNLRRVALAWQRVPVKHSPPSKQLDPDNLWESAWQNVVIDYPAIDTITGLKSRSIIETLKGYRLIFPDGTLAPIAQKALRQIAKSELGL